MTQHPRLVSILDRAGIFDAVLWMGGRARRPWYPILGYRRVHAPDPAYPFDRTRIDVDPATLDEQLAIVARWFSVIATDELVELYRGGKLPPNAAVLTFENGYREHHDVVLPMLQRHRLRAIFFVATRNLTERRVSFWDRVAYLVKRSPRERLALHYPTAMSITLGSTEASRDSVIRLLARVIQDHYALDLERFLDGVATAAGVAWGRELDRSLADDLLMTWTQVRALRDAGMDVQSQTLTGRVLSTLSPEELRQELAGSRHELERELGGAVHALAYPCGRPIDHLPQVRGQVLDAGYELGFTGRTGVNTTFGRREPLNLRRVPLGPQVRLPLFRGILAIPYLAGPPR